MNFNFSTLSNFQVRDYLPNMNDFTYRLSYFDTDELSQTLMDNQIPLALAGAFLAGMVFHKAIQYFGQSKETASEEKQITPERDWNTINYSPKFETYDPFFSSPFNDPFFDFGFGLHNRYLELFI